MSYWVTYYHENGRQIGHPEEHASEADARESARALLGDWTKAAEAHIVRDRTEAKGPPHWETVAHLWANEAAGEKARAEAWAEQEAEAVEDRKRDREERP